jgi:hypothetical protein
MSMTDKTRMAQRFDSVWARIENERLAERIRQENEAAKVFDSSFGSDEIVPEQGEKWGNTEVDRHQSGRTQS